MDPEAFEGVCETLSRRHRIVRSAHLLEECRWDRNRMLRSLWHSLYRKVCYRQIATGRRARLHRRLGEWIEEHVEPLNAAATWLADHFERSEGWQRAIKYLQLAADRAGLRFEPRQATEILEHALELVRNCPRPNER